MALSLCGGCLRKYTHTHTNRSTYYIEVVDIDKGQSGSRAGDKVKDYVLFLRKTNDSDKFFWLWISVPWLLLDNQSSQVGGLTRRGHGHGHQNIDTCSILLQQLVRH